MKIRFWRNDRREGPTHPHLSNGKPVEIDGKTYWAKIWINAEQDETKAGVDRMVDKLADENGQHAIITLDLTPAQPAAPASSAQKKYSEDDPF